jgi:Tfp pilus assembly protein PilF
MPTPSRTIRVFLSSTFRDFAEERDLLVRKVFPELRRKCRERQVELVDVDLRWGITEKEAQQGKVLPICLAEIDRSRPFFIGLLGERYGWVPEARQYDESLLMEQPWLAEHRGGKSVTELEIMYGVLNNPQMYHQSFFYFRDPKWTKARAKKDGGEAYISQDPSEKTKLKALKDRILNSGCLVVENYRSPEALAEQVKEDLWKLIDEAYPKSEMPDALSQERMRHEAYGASRRRLYLGGEKYFEFLDAAMKEKPYRPVIITGQSGGGKSALVANWLERWIKRHKNRSVIVHHLGCGADAADPARMATRLIQEIARLTGDDFKPESDADKLLEEIPKWLAIGSAWARRSKQSILIVLDGLDKVSDRQHLRWFPSFLPPRVHLAASCLKGEILDAAKSRLQWHQLKVKPFTKVEQRRFINVYLGRYRKSLTLRHSKMLQSHPLCGNPLFLLTVLEELRVYGVHEKLENRLRTLLSKPPSKRHEEEPTVDDVFEHVLARIEDDLGRKPVQSALEAIWASRAGLFRDELIAIAKITQVQWAAIQIALDESLYENGGKINFGHDYLRKAVEDRYELTGKKKQSVHRRLAKWLDDVACNAGVDERVAEELPWQLAKAAMKTELINTLTDEVMFELIYDRDQYELIRYWLELGKHPFAFYEKAWNEWKISAEDSFELSREGFKLAELLRSLGSISPLLEEMYQLAEEAANKVEKHETEFRIAVENSKGLFLLDQGNFAEAEHIFRKGLEELEYIVGRQHPDTLDSINNLAQSLWRQGKNTEAESLYQESLKWRLALFGENHPRTISSLIGCSVVAAALRKDAEAKRLLERALRISLNILGDSSTETLGIHLNIANLFSKNGSYKKAEQHYKIAERGFNKLYGIEHPLAISCQSGYAGLLVRQKKYKSAQEVFEKVLARRRKYRGDFHPETCSTHNNFANVLEQCGDLHSAVRHHRLSLKGRLKTLGPSHPDSIQSVNNLRNILEKIGDSNGAERVFTYYLEHLDQTFPKDHSLNLQTVSYLGALMKKHGKARQASRLLWQRAKVSSMALEAIRYNLACYECLEGNLEEATRLISEHLQLHPEEKAQALADEDFTAIHDWISELEV